MDIKDIKELMCMLVETDITELNLSNGTKIQIKGLSEQPVRLSPDGGACFPEG